MNKFHVCTLAAATAAFFALGASAAMAQTVFHGASDQDAWQQGYAAGSAGRLHDNYQGCENWCGRTVSNLQAPAGSAQQAAITHSYDQGYQAGLDRASADTD